MTKDIPTPSVAKIFLPAAYLSLASGALFLGLFILLHFLKSDLDPSWRPISEYALGDYGWIMTIAFFMAAVSCASLLVAIFSQVKTWPGRIGLLGIGLAALGFAIAGIFPTDPVTTKPEDVTTSGTLHGIGPVLADGIPLAAILVGWCLVKHNKVWAKMKRPIFWAGVMAFSGFIILTVAMVTMLPPSGRLGPEVKVGWPNRFMVAVYIGWVMVLASLAIKLRRASLKAR